MVDDGPRLKRSFPHIAFGEREFAVRFATVLRSHPHAVVLRYDGHGKPEGIDGAIPWLNAREDAFEWESNDEGMWFFFTDLSTATMFKMLFVG